ncbi:MAG: major facilitator superfamily 1 [Acidobacteria bacterium]|nr:major facilitator superfamily 1 [Acidobacteriota bacterium]
MIRASEAPAVTFVLAKARRRLIPFLFLLYIVAYLDRINVGFAALQMNQALGFSATVYGFGAGIFFLSYVLFEIPSNVILAKVGARLWIARIMITWGLVSSAMMFVHSASGFYTLRFLLGLAEAGFFPGIIFYLTRWFPARERARTIAAFMTATLIAGVIGGPISGALLSLHGAGGLAGWQWLFVLEGVPSIVLGVVVLKVLAERPEDATWLTDVERATLVACLRDDAGALRHETTAAALRNRRTWLLAAIYFTIPVTLYGIGFFLPQMLKTASGSSDFIVGLLSAVPYAAGAIAMVIVGRHSDRTGERRWHVLVPALVSATGLALSAASTGIAWSVVTLSIAMLGLASMFGPFWALTTSTMGGVGAAASIALVNSVGNTGGFVGPYLVGKINDETHSFALGLLAVAAMLAAGATLVLFVRDDA